ncbi:flagellar filament capping protein FliD [Paenibacillus sp. FSL H7-0357]|uniref:flagellar filament capping protein FliD n=1 Tax=unclassified Paenibacillus TaxID=185978 RepID=UPI00068F0763|nr:flagellar filament capping protein FliD [Paenibacillus sp. FSL H7-0357]
MVTRVNGFSGMDIDSMVKSMMAAKRVPLDKLTQDKQLLQWTRESYRELNSKLYDFRQNKLIVKYGGNAALNANKAITTGNTDAVKAEALASANGINMEVSVSQLAARTTLQMNTGLGQGVPSVTSLAQLDGVDLFSLSEDARTEYLKKGFDVAINGVEFKDKDGKSLFNGLTSISTMVATINSHPTANAIASYDEITGKLSIASKTSGDPNPASGYKATRDVKVGDGSTLLALFTKRTVTEVETIGAGTSDGTKTLAHLQNLLDTTIEADAEKLKYKFSVNGESFSFDGTKSINDVVAEINAKSGTTKVQAEFTGGKLKLTADSGSEVKLGGDSFELLQLFKGVKPAVGSPSDYNVKTGQNAIVSINGELIKDTNDNVFTINGVQLTLLKETVIRGPVDPANPTAPPPITGDNTIKITTQSDPDKAIESIKGFIEDYNSLIKTLNSKIDEVKYRDFRPLTDEQKKELKEADIKTWTEKAQSGLLKNNDIIKNVLSQMRGVITEKLGPLSTLGITTGNYASDGMLVIENETKLKAAISANPQLALDLFQGPGNAVNDGIFDKMADKISAALSNIAERAGTNKNSMDLSSTFKEQSVMGKTMKGYNSRILLMQRNLANTENRYYKQFTAMETAMSKMQSQSSSLLSSMGQSS